MSAYDVDFDGELSHGHIVDLLTEHVERGLVVDLGCGYAPHAEPLIAAGFTYVGLDADEASLASLRERGVAGSQFDLSDVDGLPAALEAAVHEVSGAERAVVAVLALDVLEHLVEPQLVLDRLAGWMGERSVETLGVSLPNVSFRDVAAKLVAGRWDLAESGLLDRTHLRFFTESSMLELLTRTGFDEAHRHDVVTEYSDQEWPHDHPLIRPTTAIGAVVRRARELADRHGTTHQFVRLFELDPRRVRRPAISFHDPTPTPQSVGVDRGGPRLSVVVVGAADVVDLPEADDVERIDVADSKAALAAVTSVGGVRGRSVVVIDHDAVLDERWVEQFASTTDALGGPIVRCAAGDDTPDDERWDPTFDLGEHLRRTGTPGGAVAVPVAAFQAFPELDASALVAAGLGVGSALLVALAPVIGVHDTAVPALTIPEGSSWVPSSGDRDAVMAALDDVRAELDRTGVAFGPGAASVLVRRHSDHESVTSEVRELRRQVEELNAELATPGARLGRRLGSLARRRS
ncbi:MAG: methyltransferase domain-containing protein [Actinomycetota bacterium]